MINHDHGLTNNVTEKNEKDLEQTQVAHLARRSGRWTFCTSLGTRCGCLAGAIRGPWFQNDVAKPGIPQGNDLEMVGFPQVIEFISLESRN